MKYLQSLHFRQAFLFIVSAFALLLSDAFAGDVKYSVQYSSDLSGIPPDQLSIDLYHCPDSFDALVVYVHGGAWLRGDKSNVYRMPRFFDDNNICFASVNYPLVNIGRWSVMDVQVEALAHLDVWLANRSQSSNVKAYRNVSLIGFSAGSHLLALTEKRHGWNPSVKNLILLDSASYDIKSRFFASSRRYRKIMTQLLRLDEVPREVHSALFNRYSPARVSSTPRSDGKLNILAISGTRSNSFESARALELSFKPSHGYEFNHLLRSWQHRDFPRRVGASLGYNKAILDIVLR